MDSYDVIYLGYPNWWGTMPMAVFTFLETYDLQEDHYCHIVRMKEAVWAEA